MPTLNETHKISGHVNVGFEPVYEAFLSNFENELEAGAGFCVMRDGEFLVDLTGGTSDRKRTQPWKNDTIVQVFSSTKAIAALVIAWLVENGRLNYEQPIESIWPAFAAHGKGELTIAQIMSHQSGLSGITEPMDRNDWVRWDFICDRLASQKPIWEPGTASGYHPLTYGFLVGEIGRRADAQNRTLGTILREEICAPNQIDFHIGMPKSEFHRCADLHKPRAFADLGDINPATKAAFMEKWSSTAGIDVDAMRNAELPAANGHGTAKSLARLMQIAVDGKIGDRTYLGEHTLYEFSKPRISGPDLVLPFHLTFAAGIMINHPIYFYGPNQATLGHSGWGGSCTFADPIEGLSVGYVMNKQSNVLIGDPRPVKIIDALYSCL
ncbi:MAG: class A beta-lactamase-related serine hydrolase [Acidimicrobiales bacterium]|nr:beta-lactamase family protein [Hyphomonadaceae bacterium]RZV40634.1 MAG: class A beta-lactamase-related serine hydrolase [Acidimicrobiales bacterium]